MVSSWGDYELEELATNMMKESEEKYKLEKIRKEKEYKRELEDKGRKKIEKNFSKTLVCNGAILKCPNGYIETVFADITEAGYGYNPDIPDPKTEVIEFLVTEPKAFLMGIDPIGSTKDVTPQNFKPNPDLRCKLDGNPCKIKEKAYAWLNTSKTLINGFQALTKNSNLICTNQNQCTLLWVEDNGQNPEIKNAKWEAFLVNQLGLTPTTRDVIGLVYSVVETGTGIILIFTGVGSGAGVTIIVGGFHTFNGIRDFGKISLNKDILYNLSKGIVAEDSANLIVESYDFGVNAYSIYGLVKGGYGLFNSYNTFSERYVASTINNSIILEQMKPILKYGQKSTRIALKDYKNALTTATLPEIKDYMSLTNDTVGFLNSQIMISEITNIKMKSYNMEEIKEKVSKLRVAYDKESFYTEQNMFSGGYWNGE